MTYEQIKEKVAKDIKMDILEKLGNGNFLIGINHYTSRKLKEFQATEIITFPKEYTKSGKETIYGNISY